MELSIRDWKGEGRVAREIGAVGESHCLSLQDKWEMEDR